MSKYLRKFETEAAYSAATIYTPSVSLIASNMSVKFDPYIPPTPTFSGLTVTYNISDISQPTDLFKGGGSGSGSGSGSGGALPSAMIIDGTEVDVTSAYAFDTVGEHIVNYSFAENQIPEHFLDGEGPYVFSTVTKVEIGDALTSIGIYAFVWCSSLTSVTIGNGVTSIGDEAFNQCSGLTSCAIGGSVATIGGQAFTDCESLTSVVIPDSVTSIGSYAFLRCTSLTSIDIPNGVTNIGGAAFNMCSNLTSITVNATTPPTLGNIVFNGSTCPIYVPSASLETYKAANKWSAYASRIQGIPNS